MTVQPSALPLFSWLDHRAAGVLLHPTALPGEFGIGTLGPEADRFIEFLAAAGFRYWQICPLGPTGFGDSPYQCFSAFAGNPYLIDPWPLIEHDLLDQTALGPLIFLDSRRVDYGNLYRFKWPLLFAAWERYRTAPGSFQPYGDFAAFAHREAAWLDDYGLFQALKDRHGGRPWWEWPAEDREVHRARRAALPEETRHRAQAHRFFQYLFFGQWQRLRTRAASRGVAIVGDLPIFVALDSADVWAHPELFQLDPATLKPIAVAGVPPDYFSADGQLWGNPLHDWVRQRDTGFAWWRDRLASSFALYDVVRIDHFRGFESYWSIPAGATTAKAGRWERGPGLSFFEFVRREFPGARIVAEDLGILTEAVVQLRRDTGLPGMAVLQFAFGGKADNFYLPHNLEPNSVLYPGTHDNDTALGWYASASATVQDHVRRYFRVSGHEIGWDFVRAAYAAVSRLAIVPLQDLLNLGSAARFNTPGRPDGNWQWRYQPAQLDELQRRSAGYLQELGRLYGRIAETDDETAADTVAHDAPA
jgi:4-alpha-glucanotransferase